MAGVSLFGARPNRQAASAQPAVMHDGPLAVPAAIDDFGCDKIKLRRFEVRYGNVVCLTQRHKERGVVFFYDKFLRG